MSQTPVLRGCSWLFHAAGYYPSNGESREEAIRKGRESVRRVMEEFRRSGIWGCPGRPSEKRCTERCHGSGNRVY